MILSRDRNINRGTGGREGGTPVVGCRDSRRHNGPTGLRVDRGGGIGVAPVGKGQCEAAARICAVAFQQVHRSSCGRDRACRGADGIAHAAGAADIGGIHGPHVNNALCQSIFEFDRVLLLRRGRLHGADDQIRRCGFRQHSAVAIKGAGASTKTKRLCQRIINLTRLGALGIDIFHIDVAWAVREL